MQEGLGRLTALANVLYRARRRSQQVSELVEKRAASAKGAYLLNDVEQLPRVIRRRLEVWIDVVHAH